MLTDAVVGAPAPDFASRNQHGQPVSLADLRGAPAILVFYPFAFTGICTGELATLSRQLPEFLRLGARLLALSTDTMFALRVFAEQESLEFDLVTDHWPHGEIASAYGVFDAQLGCARRGSFVLDAEGTVLWTVVNEIGEARDMADLVAAMVR